MSVDQLFWDDLLGYFRYQMLVAVVGPDLPAAVVGGGAAEQTCTAMIGERLAERYHLVLPPPVTMEKAVAEILRTSGREEVEMRVYRVIDGIVSDLGLKPGNALRDLAAIDDLRLFVSTTPDRLLAQALNEVRFQDQPLTREISFSLNQSTEEQARNAVPAGPTDTVVLSLFGQVSPTAQYAIHEEDKLEWLHALLTGAANLPSWLASPLKRQPMLFIGCEIPDWVGRFLVRMESANRLSAENKQFFFVNSPDSGEPSLSEFFATYGRRAQIQQLEMEPADFVTELRARWEKLTSRRPKPATASPSRPPVAERSIFISYIREDFDAARRLCDAITKISGEGEVWFDERQLLPGDDWEEQILSAIRRSVRLFIPVISANTERAEEGYVFREWREAAERSGSIPRRRFIVPVVIDADADADPGRYRQIPEEFRRFNFGRAPAGDPDEELVALLTAEIRAMRVRGAS